MPRHICPQGTFMPRHKCPTLGTSVPPWGTLVPRIGCPTLEKCLNHISEIGSIYFTRFTCICKYQAMICACVSACPLVLACETFDL